MLFHNEEQNKKAIVGIVYKHRIDSLCKLDQKIAIVTGSSSGIGFATSLLLARNGFYTFATMRNLDRARDIMDITKKEELPLQVVKLDVNADKSVREAIDKIVAEKKRIDVLVNNAGYGLIGCFEDLSIEEIKAQFETNLFGIMRVTQSVLPIMRRQKYGVIVNVGSVAGHIGYPAMPAYIASKFALRGLSESIRYEVGPFGIKVVIIETGVVKTNFMDSNVIAKKALGPNSPYAQLTQKIDAGLRFLVEKGTAPEEVAKVVLKAVTSDDPRPRYLVGNDAAMLIEAKKNMSDVEFENFMKKELGI